MKTTIHISHSEDLLNSDFTILIKINRVFIQNILSLTSNSNIQLTSMELLSYSIFKNLKGLLEILYIFNKTNYLHTETNCMMKNIE